MRKRGCIFYCFLECKYQLTNQIHNTVSQKRPSSAKWTKQVKNRSKQSEEKFCKTTPFLKPITQPTTFWQPMNSQLPTNWWSHHVFSIKSREAHIVRMTAYLAQRNCQESWKHIIHKWPKWNIIIYNYTVPTL